MKLFFSTLLYILFLLPVIIGQPKPIDKEKFFTDETIFPVTLVGQMNKIFSTNYLKKPYKYPASFTCKLQDSSVVCEPILTEVRGHLRREYCNIPPLRLIFKTNDSSSSMLAPLKTLKLVNGCMYSNTYSQYVLMEFLTYKIYNLLTEKSFRVRLAEVTYVDSSGKKKPFHNYAFFLEDVKEMAKRNNCREFSKGNTKTETTDRKQMTLVALFEYMIGNTDWSVTGKHNIRTIIPRNDSGARPIAVPYDFDYAGLVNTNYAVPDPLLGTKSVVERVYRGYPRTMEELNEALEIFKKQKDSIFFLINNFDLLSKSNKKEMTLYLEKFYDLIKDQRDVKYTFIDGARTD
jgi:hypothetical protein